MTEIYMTATAWLAEQGPVFHISVFMIWTSALGLLLLAATRKAG